MDEKRNPRFDGMTIMDLVQMRYEITKWGFPEDKEILKEIDEEITKYLKDNPPLKEEENGKDKV